ncbi:hypothetical protein CAPTEDRAFT_111085, partial [Capitella teleta]
NWDIILDFMASMVKQYIIGPDDTRVAVVIFSNDATVYFTLDKYDTETEVIEAIRNMPYEGGTTNTGAALRLTASGW